MGIGRFFYPQNRVRIGMVGFVLSKKTPKSCKRANSLPTILFPYLFIQQFFIAKACLYVRHPPVAVDKKI